MAAPDHPSLLIAFDGSPAAVAATRAAAALFPGARATVLAVHGGTVAYERAGSSARVALTDDVIAGGIAALAQADAERATAAAAEGGDLARRSGLDAESDTVMGTSPWAEIRAVADRRGADVIVCGTTGRGALSRAVLGSTSSALLYQAKRPVMVVPDVPGDLTGPLVIGYDGSEPGRLAVVAAGRLFPGREAIVVNVWESAVRRTYSGRMLAGGPVPEFRELAADLDEYFAEGAREVAEEGAAVATEHGLRPQPHALEAGSGAWRGLVAAAESAGAAAIVVGSRGQGAVASVLLGSVSSGLVHNADLPVLVVPD